MPRTSGPELSTSSAAISSRSVAGAFTDPAIPAGFAPFNVYATAGKVYVAYAKQDDDKEDDIPGNGNGYIDVFDPTDACCSAWFRAGN